MNLYFLPSTVIGLWSYDSISSNLRRVGLTSSGEVTKSSTFSTKGAFGIPRGFVSLFHQSSSFMRTYVASFPFVSVIVSANSTWLECSWRSWSATRPQTKPEPDFVLRVQRHQRPITQTLRRNDASNSAPAPSRSRSTDSAQAPVTRHRPISPFTPSYTAFSRCSPISNQLSYDPSSCVYCAQRNRPNEALGRCKDNLSQSQELLSIL